MLHVAWRDWEGGDMGRAHGGGGGRIEGKAWGSTVRFGGGLMGFLVDEAFPHHLYNAIK